MKCPSSRAAIVLFLSCILLFAAWTSGAGRALGRIFVLHPEANLPCAPALPLTALLYSCPPPDAAPACNASPPLPDAEGASCGGTSNAALAAFVEGLAVRERAPAVASFAVLAWPGAGSNGGAAAAPPQCWELGARHTLMLQALDAAGNTVDAGGEYLEAQLRGPLLAYRPRVLDLGSGRYTVEVHLPADELLAGQQVRLRVLRLWRRWGGLAVEDYRDEAEEFVALEADFTLSLLGEGSSWTACQGSSVALRHPGEILLPPPTQECRGVDFTDSLAWHGHWLRVAEGEGARCERGACSGDPTRLLTPWVYRLGSGVAGPHRAEGCYFHLFTPAEARDCVNGSWWHMTSDSQGRDFADTLLRDVLDVDTTGWHASDNAYQRIGYRFFDISGWRDPPAYPPGVFPTAERSDWPASPDGAGAFLFRISNHFIGHFDPYKDFYGLRTLLHPAWRSAQVQWLQNQLPRVPDLFLANSGTHDAIRCDDGVGSDRCFGPSGRRVLWDYLSDLENAVGVWQEMGAVFSNSTARRSCAPRWIWRGASAPGGQWRKFKANPQKLEVFDRLTHARLAGDTGAPGPPCPAPHRRWSFTGFFDMSWDAHFEGADRQGGPHYGSSNVEENCDGAKCRPVEIMHVHALLNALCPMP